MRDANDILREDGPIALDPAMGLVPAYPSRQSTEATAPGNVGSETSDPGRCLEGRKSMDLAEYHVSRLLEDACTRLVARAEGRERPVDLPWESVNRATGGGLWPGLHILVGNTGSGKTQFGIEVGLHAAKAGVVVVYVGLELGQIDFTARLLGLCNDLHWSRLFLGQDPAALSTAMSNHLTLLTGLPLFLMTAGCGFADGEGIEEACAQAREWARKLNPDEQCSVFRPVLVIVDFLQLLQTPVGTRDDLRERIARAAYAGRHAALRHDAAVLMLSSTARENYATLRRDTDSTTKTGSTGMKELRFGEGDPARFVGLGKESGEIEFAADTLFVLGRGPEPTLRYLGVAKLRAGTTGWVQLEFNGNRFKEWAVAPVSTGTAVPPPGKRLGGTRGGRPS